MKNKVIIISGLIVIGLIFGGIFYFTTKDKSIIEKDKYFNVSQFDLIKDGLNLKVDAVPLIDDGDKYSTYGTSMDFNGFDFKIICDKYNGNIKEINIEINSENSKEGATYLLFYEEIKGKVINYLGADNCKVLESTENNKNKCVITKEGD